ncbi:MAG: hypothetical protein K2X73_14345 [Sphingomonas sp.]|uniref:hypothetical protein n=1 Tax=Sphingomonas sp. TaxID=28214 RepID=UPI0025EE1D1F|nr:hypothetical protein [Sphingomonas sp.]MBX9883138.1 hypothetical protein [Sphingomonas sp.]
MKIRVYPIADSWTWEIEDDEGVYLRSTWVFDTYDLARTNAWAESHLVNAQLELQQL